MNTTRKEIIINSIKATLGLVIFGIGLHLVIQANIGTAPWDVLIIGIANKTGHIYGNVSIIVGVILVIIDILILKQKIGIGSIIDALIVGKTVDALNYINIVKPVENSVALSLLLMGVGFMLEGFGQYIYMKQGLGYGPKDTLQIGLAQKMPNISVGKVNIIILSTVLIIGWVIGGPVGLGSFIAPFGTGFAQELVFGWKEFDPKTVENQNILQSLKVLFS